MAIPSQARKHFREGVETRRAAPKPHMGNGEGIVQTTNPPSGAAKAEVVRKSAGRKAVRGQFPPPASQPLAERTKMPSLKFVATGIGSTSSDSPKTITLLNSGNAALSFPFLPNLNNPFISDNFTLDSSVTSACPLVSAGSTTAATLAAGSSCLLSISFSPVSISSVSGSLILTDTNLNAPAPDYAKHAIVLSGAGNAASQATLTALSHSIRLLGDAPRNRGSRRYLGQTGISCRQKHL